MTRRNKNKSQKVANTILTGAGANTTQDRGSQQTAAIYSRNPYFRNDFYSRWQEWVRWYNTSWEAGKIVDIPVQDAFRIPVKITGLEQPDIEAIEKYMKYLDVNNNFKRAATIERLLGGCVIIVGVKDENDNPESVLDLKRLKQGGITFLNVITTEKITKCEYETDVFSPEYDKPKYYMINGIKTHVSRLIVFDGDPLFNHTSMNLLQNFRYNPAGFGESVLSRLYDSLVRATGTQEGAYHLVNLASVLLVKCERFIDLQATRQGNAALNMLDKIAEQLSIYRGAVIDGKGIEIAQHSATFGSVPELLNTCLQILAAGSDIPATRFLGDSPSGLNSTGESDLENYYNNVDSYQTTRLEPKYRKMLDLIGSCIWGFNVWKEKSKNLAFEFEPLWNINKMDQATVDKTRADILRQFKEDGIISDKQYAEEINSKKILDIELDVEEYDEDREEMIDGSDIPSLRDETDRVIDTIGAKPNVDSGAKPEAGQG